MTDATVTPWLHIALACGAFLVLAGLCARGGDRESAYGLLVIGALLLIFVAVEHGVLAYFRT